MVSKRLSTGTPSWLFRTTLKTSIALLCVPFLVIIVAWQGRHDQVPGLFLWTIASFSIGQAATILAPISAGVAAWVARDTRKEGTKNILESLADRGSGLHRGQLFAIVFWVWVAWGLYSLYLIIIGLAMGTWGSLDYAPVVIGWLLILTCTVVGYAVGLRFTSGYVPLVVPVAMFAIFILTYGLGNDSPQLAWMGNFAETVADGEPSSIKYLSPMLIFTGAISNPRETAWDTITPPFLGLLFGILVCAIGLVAWQLREKQTGFIATPIGIAIAVYAAMSLLALPAKPADLPKEEIAYQPLCQGSPIKVCVHPGYEANLEKTADIANTLLSPVAGLPGVPTVIEQFETGPNGDRVYQIYFESTPPDELVMNYIGFLFDGTLGFISPGQSVIGYWLFTLVIDDPTGAGLRRFLPDPSTYPVDMQVSPPQFLQSYVDRWNALDPISQRAWLESNWTALLNGEISWDDLP